MSTVAELIDRIKRDWLEAADSQPTRFTLGAAVTTAVQTELTYNDALLAPEEVDLLGPGTLIEIDSEEMILEDVDESANTLTVAIRGANGTTAATHTNGSEATVAPIWRRKVIFDAIADAVDQLYPDLYQVLTTSLTVSSTGYTQVAADVMEPLYFFGTLAGTTSYDRYPVTFLDHFDAVASGKAVLVDSLPYGAAGYMAYKAKFDRPESEFDDLVEDLGLETSWEQIVIVAAAAYLIAGREFEQIDQERLTKQLERQGFPVLTATRIRQALLQYRDQLMVKAVDALRQREPVSVSYTSGL